jgi:hypothetical protein
MDLGAVPDLRRGAHAAWARPDRREGAQRADAPRCPPDRHPGAREPAVRRPRGPDLRGDAVAIADEEIGLLLARRGKRPVQLAPDFYDGLEVEDGVTLRWEELDGLGYRDVGTLPKRDGCPRRSKFAEQARTDRLIVSRSDVQGGAIRVCDRTTGKDPVILSSSVVSDASYLGIAVVGLSDTTLVLGSEGSDRYSGCTGTTVTVREALTGRVLRTASSGVCELFPPRAATPVLTPQGAAAWLVADRLIAIDGTTIRELDKGAITDLAPTADGVTWRSSGTVKSAPLA